MTDIGKLPKWAQERIRLAERRADLAEQELLKRWGDSPAAEVVVLRWNGAEGQFYPLGGKFTTVRFITPNGMFDATYRDECLVIQGETAIAVEPRAANAITVRASAADQSRADWRFKKLKEKATDDD